MTTRGQRAHPDGQEGAVGVEYVVLVVVLGLALVGGVAALQAAVTRTIGSQSNSVATSPQFVGPPSGSGGPSDPTPVPIPDPGPDPDPSPGPAPTASFNAGAATTQRSGSTWSATVVLNVGGTAGSVTLSYALVPSGSGSVSCTVVSGECQATAGGWPRNPPNRVDGAIFTVIAIDGESVTGGAQLAVDRP
jgi:Flp pilus assembly pilin Flp